MRSPQPLVWNTTRATTIASTLTMRRIMALIQMLMPMLKPTQPRVLPRHWEMTTRAPPVAKSLRMRMMQRSLRES